MDFRDVDWAVVGAVATIAAGTVTLLGLIVAIATLVHQSRALRRTLASQTYHGLVAHFNEFQRLLIDDPRLRTDLFDRTPGELRGSRRHRANWALGILFNWYEDVALQAETWRVLPRHLRRHWRSTLAMDLRSPVVAAYWDRYARRFHPQLGAWVADARARAAKESRRATRRGRGKASA